MRRAFVIGNAAWDETLALATLPGPGASVHARLAAAGPGGKGLNQAVALVRAGVPVTLFTALGNDEQGRKVARAIEAEGIDLVAHRTPRAATDRSVILVAASGENLVITTRGAAGGIGAPAVAAWLERAARGDLCVVQGNLDFAVTKAAVDVATRIGLMVAFNPSPVDPRHLDLIAHIDALFLNEDEAQTLTGTSGDAATGALRRAGASAVVLSCGARGALLAAASGMAMLPAPRVAAVDPTAAGDVLMATTLAHAAPRGWQPDAEALAAGIRAAALAVGRPGALAAVPTREELARILAAR